MIVIETWPGLVTNASPYMLPPGAAVTQVNMQCISPGSIQVRPGVVAHTSGSTDIAQMVRFDSATQQRVAVVTYAGTVTLVTL
jgi:hypothetical protein